MAAIEPITINVAPAAARANNSASPEEREQLDFILSVQVLATTQRRPLLLDLANEISRKAQDRGLTREILEELLSDE